MSKNSTNIKERILYLAEKKELTKQNFFKKSSLKYSNFTGKSKMSDLSSGSLAEILLIYPDVNPEWLLTGKGSMLKTEIKPAERPGEGIPLIPLDAMAGFGEGGDTIMSYDTERYVVPEFNELKVDFMIKVKGDSMFPDYYPGDLVACKKLPLDTFFQWNKVYVLDTDQGPLLKKVHPSDQEEHLHLVSSNKNYPPYDLPLKGVYALAIVVGVIRLT